MTINNIFLKSTNFLAMLACLLWASAFVGIKIGLEHHSPLQFAGFRFAISGILLALYFGNIKMYMKQVRQNIPFLLKLMLVQTVLQYSLFYTGINMLPASISALIIGSSPLVAAIMAHFLMQNDKINFRKSLSLTLGVIGVFAIAQTKDGNDASKTVSALGVLILILNNVVSIYSNILVSKKKGNISLIVISSSTLLVGGLGLILMSIPIEGYTLHNVNLEYIGALAWLSLLSAVSFSIWYSLLKRPGVKVSELNVWKFTIPVVGAILAWVILPNEKAQLESILGMILIMASLLILNYKKKSKLRVQADGSGKQ